MALLPIPEPYDFALSTERFRRFGPDLANLWHEGGLHRVVGGREVRIELAPCAVDVEPLDEEVAAVVSTLLGLGFDLAGFEAFAHAHSPELGDVAERLRGFRPPIAPDPFETLVTSITAQQVSLASAFAIRSRMIERLGEEASFAVEEFELVKLFAAHVSIALRNAAAHRAVELRAETDQLTGLWNHGALTDQIVRGAQIKLSRRQKHGVANRLGLQSPPVGTPVPAVGRIAGEICGVVRACQLIRFGADDLPVQIFPRRLSRTG